MKAIAAAVLMIALVGCKQVQPPITSDLLPNTPHWVGDKAYMGSKECGSVWRSDGHLIGYSYVVSERFRYEIISGGGESPANDYVDKVLRAEVENYCATQFYYYGQDGNNSRPQDRERQITMWDDMTHSKFGGSK